MNGLRELHEAATPGPWEYERVEPELHEDIKIFNLSWEQDEADLNLIVALRNAAPEIADLIEAARMVDGSTMAGQWAADCFHNALAALGAKGL